MQLPDPARILRASSIRFGDFRARGLPAILLGVSAVVIATGTARALRAAAPTLAEALREATKLASVLNERADRPKLTS
ncbi:MAG: hypothetical protein JO103_02370 [Candidatus Eremiobacteraeota bacterium]|nr:hypothetical protein [Candidatus Eremiobacteraeota bacterium]MBV9409452.1 hypothetical protein [Candidatus Eremiobacteraeota bacterium]